MKKNGKIEFYRFVFCISVLLFHAEKYILGEAKLDVFRMAFFPHGSIGVEFFFLVSGFFLGKHAYKKYSEYHESDKLTHDILFRDSAGYLTGRIKRIFPTHVVAYLIALFAYIISVSMSMNKTLWYILDNVPSFFLVQMSGLKITSANHVEWFLSAMLIATAVIYPICRKWYSGFTSYIAPIGALLILGYLFRETGTLTGVFEEVGFMYKATLRAIAEMALGTTAFEITRRFSDSKTHKKSFRLQITLLEIISFALVILFVICTFPKKYEFYALALLFVLLVCAGSGAGYGSRFFDSKFFYALGSMTLPIYLCQIPAVYMVQGFLSKRDTNAQIWFMILITLVFAITVKVIGLIARMILNVDEPER